MPAGTVDTRFRWLLDVVDRGQPQKLLATDRQLRGSLKETDRQYTQMAHSATSASAKQAEAARTATSSTVKHGDAVVRTTADVGRLNTVQTEALSIYSRIAAAQNELAASYDRAATAAGRAADAEAKRNRTRRGFVHAGAGGGGFVSSEGGAIGGALTGVGKTGLLLGGGALALAGDVTAKGLKLGASVRAGAAGIGGLTGLDPRSATAVALIASAESVSARGLGTAFATLGKQLTGYEKHVREVQAAVSKGEKAPKANAAEETFGKLGIGPKTVAGLQNNLPAAFDLVYKRAAKLPAAERATVLKTFLGRGATLGGQIELGGPLTSQIADVRKQLGGLDPKKLQDLHETEIKLKLATDSLELSFAQTFGPDLIKLFDTVSPAIKPIGEALRTAVGVPLEFAKKALPEVFRGIKSGFDSVKGPAAAVHQANRAGIEPVYGGGVPFGAPPILGRAGRYRAPAPPSGPNAGTRGGTGVSRSALGLEPVLRVPHGHAETILPGSSASLLAKGEATKRASEPSALESAAKKIGSALHVAASEAAKYGGELVKAVQPAIPFFQNVALPVVEGFGKGVVGAFKIAIPIIHAGAVALGALGHALGPLNPELKILGIGLGILLAGPMLGLLTKLPKIGPLFRLLGAPIKIAGGAVGGFGRVLGGLGGVLEKTGGLFDKFPGRIGRVGGAVFKAAGSLTSSVGKGLSGISAIATGKGAQAANDLGKGIRGGAGKLVAAGKFIAGQFIGPLGGVGKAGAERLTGAFASGGVTAAMKGIGLSLAGLIGAGIVAGIGAYIYAHRQEILEQIKTIVTPGRSTPTSSKATPRGPIEEGEKKVTELFGKLRGGGRVGYASGGMVPSLVSPGEQVITSTGSFTVPGSPTAADSVAMHLPMGAAVLTWDGQSMMQGGASLDQALAHQRPHFAQGGVVVGKVSTFGPPSEAAGKTATGASSSAAGVAIRPGATFESGRSSLNHWWQIGINGHTGRLKQIDLGPNQSTGRRIDVTGAGARALGFDPTRFPTDSTGTAVLLNGPGQGSTKATIPTIIGKGHREGLLSDALQKGIEAGGLGEGSGAFVSELAQAVGTVSKTSSIAGLPGSVGGAFGGLKVGRLDQGLDFSGAGPVKALGDGTVMRNTIWPGWPGTGGVVYRSGSSVFYVMEDFKASVKPKQRIAGGQVIGSATGGSTGIEAGLANASGTGPLTPYNGKADGTPMPGAIRFKKIAGYRGGGLVGGVYRKGGRAGGAPFSRAISGLISTAGTTGTFESAVASLDGLLEGVAETKLARMRARLVTQASRGGAANVVKSLQAVISVIDHIVGKHIGQLWASAEVRTSAIARGTAANERVLQARGIDPSSAAGLKFLSTADSQQTAVARGNVARYKAALQSAGRTHNPKVIEEATEKLTQAQEELDTSLVKGLDDRRQLLRTAAAESVAHAQSGVSGAQTAISSLEDQFRLVGKANTPGAEQAHAGAIYSSLIPQLKNTMAASELAYSTARDTGGSQSELDQLLNQVQEAGAAIGAAMAEAAELIRQASEEAAAEATEKAAHGVSLATIGEQRLETEQRIKGSYEGGGQERASYIEKVVVPAIQAEVQALESQKSTAESDGNSKLAEQIGEQIAQRQNDLLQAQLDELEAIKGNTTVKPGGSLAFTSGGEQLTDTLVTVGSGL